MGLWLGRGECERAGTRVRRPARRPDSSERAGRTARSRCGSKKQMCPPSPLPLLCCCPLGCHCSVVAHSLPAPCFRPPSLPPSSAPSPPLSLSLSLSISLSPSRPLSLSLSLPLWSLHAASEAAPAAACGEGAVAGLQVTLDISIHIYMYLDTQI